MKTLAELGALRQLKHNDRIEGSVLVYDKETTDAYVAELKNEIEYLRGEMPAFAIFDNPKNRRREEWREGRLHRCITQECLDSMTNAGRRNMSAGHPIYKRLLEAGPWWGGRIQGDPNSVPSEEIK